MNEMSLNEIMPILKARAQLDENVFKTYIKDYKEERKNNLRKEIAELEKQIKDKKIDLSLIPPPTPYCSVQYFCQYYSSKDGDISNEC